MVGNGDRNLNGIVFDKDGTLFDFRASWGRWAKDFLGSMARDEVHATRMGVAIGYDLKAGKFAPDSPVIAATADDISAALLPLLPHLTRRDLTERIDTAAAGAVMSETVPLRPLLSHLRGLGFKLGVATNDSESPARAHLDAHRITEFFDFVAGYDSGYGAKPDPGMCLAFARSVNIEPGRIAMVGDSLHDLDAGRAAGMVTIAVLTGIATAADLAPVADVILQDIGEIPDWLGLRQERLS